MMDKALGQILLEKNIISQLELESALMRQRQEKGKYLGQILFEMGVPQEEINKALYFFDKRKPIGQILLDLKALTPQQLEDALTQQRQLQKEAPRKLLGMLLVEMGYISYDEYSTALSKHFNIPIISLEEFFPSTELQKVVGEKYARKHLILVLENNDKMIKVALAEPNLLGMEELQKGGPGRKRIEFYLARPDEIESCLDRISDSPFMTRYK